MKTMEAIKVLVTTRIRDAFGEFPVVVTESPEDLTTLWVQVFAVPDEKVREVKDLILRLQDTDLPEGDVLLLPMVKNLSVTREHYPQYVQSDSTAMLAIIGRFFDDRKEKRYVLRSGNLGPAVEISGWLFGQDYLRYQTLGESALTQRQAPAVLTAANTELALAA